MHITIIAKQFFLSKLNSNIIGHFENGVRGKGGN